MDGTQKTEGVSQGSGTFSSAASEELIQHVAAKLRERNIEVVVVDDGDAARKAVLERLPEGAEAHAGKSKTLEDAGIFQALQEPGRYDFLRDRYLKMDRKTQAREIRKLIAAPDFMLGSVNAVTEDGVLVATSATGSQLGGYVSGAGKLILVVGSQKIVPDLDTALRRIREHAFAWSEDACTCIESDHPRFSLHLAGSTYMQRGASRSVDVAGLGIDSKRFLAVQAINGKASAVECENLVRVQFFTERH